MFWRLVVCFVTFALAASLLAFVPILTFLSSDLGSISFGRIVQITLGIALVSLPVAWYLARQFVRPFHELREGANRIAKGDYRHHIYGGIWRESRSLARNFNEMSLRLASQISELEGDREQLRAILGGMIEGVIAVDPSECVLFANEAAGSMLDFDPERAVSRKIWEVTRQPQVLEILQKALRGSEPCREDLDSLGATNRRLSLYVAPLPRHGNTAAVMVIHDITELRRLERLRRDFAANVSHELKTPLTVILSQVEALLDGAVEDPVARRPFLEHIASSSERLHALILDLIRLTAIESKDQQFDYQSVAVREAVLDCQERHQRRADAKHLQLVVQAADAANDVAIWVDDEACHQILDNLVDNAVKYTQDGGLIQIRWKTDERNVCLQVEDNGPGIPETDLPRVFERFYRVDKARSRELGGTGLGLAIVKHLVHEMGGSVRVQSQLGIGTTFTVSLPRAIEEKS
jgi:two-component system phosphate regulon sensor histidine kinase PhoR